VPGSEPDRKPDQEGNESAIGALDEPARIGEVLEEQPREQQRALARVGCTPTPPHQSSAIARTWP
jgi:hypothetical protein